MTQEMTLRIMKTGTNVFLTGEPGSGKTYTVNKYVGYLRSHGIEPAITASTGIAATHLGGMTIHSWSGIGIKERLTKADLRHIAENQQVKKRISKTKVLIIDEISMLAPKTLEMIEIVCREIKKSHLPFGGVQVVLVGDFFQLPPIIKRIHDEDSQDDLFDEKVPRFAYDSPVFRQAGFVTCYITEQFRQDDSALLSILSKIRRNSFDETSMALIRQRKVDFLKVPEFAPKLFSHNLDVDRINDQMLSKISRPSKLFSMESHGPRALVSAMKKGCLSPENLKLKCGASVMFTKNNLKEGFVNGTLGEVVSFESDSNLPVVKIRSGREITVSYSDWTVEENGLVKAKLSQIPLRLAWAITVHKSQGISLDEAVIDLSRVFEFGQGYVALSRVRRLSGIHLLGWNKTAFQVDPEVIEKDEEFRSLSLETESANKLLSISELKRAWEDFIILNGGVIKTVENFTKCFEKVSTYDQTFKLWQEGKNLKEIAKIRELNIETILGHLGRLADDGKIKRGDLESIVPPNLQDDVPKIQAVFDKLGRDKLSPVFSYFKGRYSYGDLKIARILMDS